MTNDNAPINEGQRELQEKFRAAVAMAVDLCLDAGLHPAHMIDPLKDQLAWCVEAKRIAEQ
jgi:hypothetical protein